MYLENRDNFINVVIAVFAVNTFIMCYLFISPSVCFDNGTVKKNFSCFVTEVLFVDAMTH